jgi:hypothetical protein
MDAVQVKINDLLLDPNNYRLRSNPKFSLTKEKLFDSERIQKSTEKLIAGENNFGIYDLIESFKSNGWLKVDQILVKKYLNTKKYIVIEGNRRVAALKFLQKEFENGFDVGQLKSELFDKGVEVVLYEYTNPNDYLVLQGLRHISGNRKWDRYNQAKLLFELNQTAEFKNTLEISKRIGAGSKQDIDKDIKAYEAIQEFVNYIDAEGLWNMINPTEKFEIFFELIGKENLKSWLDYDVMKVPHFKNEKRKIQFFSWLLPQISENEETGELERNKAIIFNHKQLRILDDYINDKSFVKRLEETRDIEETRNENASYIKKTAILAFEDVLKKLNNIPSGSIVSLSKDEISKLQEIIDLCKKYVELNNKK